MIARIVPISVGWMLSGTQQTFGASQRAVVLQVAAERAVQYPRLVFSNPEKVTRDGITDSIADLAAVRIRRRKVLGGLIHEYKRAA